MLPDELNALLFILVEVFPEHEVSTLRNLLLDSSQESRLHIVADALLHNPKKFKTRFNPLKSGQLTRMEMFRPLEYIRATEQLLILEYQGLSKSTICNVMLENNNDYLRSREALHNISSRSWRLKVRSWFTKPQPPFVLPNVIDVSTGCPLLDNEIYALGRSDREAQSAQDEQLAKTLNEEDYTREAALLEYLTVCSEGHFFCRSCLDRSVNEALYGQGGCLLREKGTVRCISSVAVPACRGFVASELLSHVLVPNLYHQLEDRFARDDLQYSALNLTRCPGCHYAAFEQGVALASLRPKLLRIGPLSLLTILTFQLYALSPTLLFGLVLLLISLYHALSQMKDISKHVPSWCDNVVTRIRRRSFPKHRMLFKCENPRCNMDSCRLCGKRWTAFHNCHQDAIDNERLYVERAMSEAVKRTCPQCRTSFVKTGGCNMLTCPCGYKMCYTCREDLRQIRYDHFCRHFRTLPGLPCNQCDSCNLYVQEDEQAVAKEAAQRAKREWATLKNKDDVNRVSNSQDLMTGAVRSALPFASRTNTHIRIP
ncbi:hypothetical protein BU17DRAFT_41922 [Hysterangium stoloniferum]|nr:hypothetical protein BU17DRAFT_41922 [Hysterangium stoloniferum]